MKNIIEQRLCCMFQEFWTNHRQMAVLSIFSEHKKAFLLANIFQSHKFQTFVLTNMQKFSKILLLLYYICVARETSCSKQNFFCNKIFCKFLYYVFSKFLFIVVCFVVVVVLETLYSKLAALFNILRNWTKMLFSWLIYCNFFS